MDLTARQLQVIEDALVFMNSAIQKKKDEECLTTVYQGLHGLYFETEELLDKIRAEKEKSAPTSVVKYDLSNTIVCAHSGAAVFWPDNTSYCPECYPERYRLDSRKFGAPK